MLGSNRIQFLTNGQEAARIDASQNLLVGTTDTDPSNNGAGGDAGHAFSSTGYISSARSEGTVALFNRMDSDGDIAAFRKDGVVLGTIASDNGSNLVVKGQGNNAALLFNHTNARIEPYTNSVTDLGRSAAKFKDLYLSGGVYLGGTGAANKLSDFETGSWNPSPARYTGGAITATYNTQDGYYTKVGNLVTCSFMIKIASISSQGSSLTYISGLPYAPARSYYDAGVTGNNSGIATVDIVSLLAHIDSRFYMRQSGSTHSNASADWAVGELSGTITYKTNS